MLFCLFFICLLFLCVSPVGAQSGYTTYLAPQINSLRLEVNGDAQRLPVLKLGGDERLTVSFDDLGHEYRRFTYTLQHCDHLGRPSERLFDTDFMRSAAAEEVIEDYQPSLNTTVQYTHYSFTLPNSNMQPLLSGNYRLTVSCENEAGEPEPVVVTYFAVVDVQASIRATCSTNTDVDWNDAHQQLTLAVNMGDLPLRSPEDEVKLVILQNRRYADAVVAPKPTAQNGTTLLWEHSRELLFKAGNEFRKMEMLSTRYPGMHGESVKWFEPYYHYVLFADAARPNYLYDEDRNGLYLTRSSGASNPDVEADYAIVHFTYLSDEPIAGREVYLSGSWTVPQFSPKYRMTYNGATRAYEASLLLKQGYYNYQYLCTPTQAAPPRGSTAECEGDYFQTENEYTILVYYHQTGERYERLVGAITPIYRHK